MEQSMNKMQPKGEQFEGRIERGRRMSLKEMHKNMYKQMSRHVFNDGYNDKHYDDDDADCYCD